jgi:hypothetical protein
VYHFDSFGLPLSPTIRRRNGDVPEVTQVKLTTVVDYRNLISSLVHGRSVVIDVPVTLHYEKVAVLTLTENQLDGKSKKSIDRFDAEDVDHVTGDDFVPIHYGAEPSSLPLSIHMGFSAHDLQLYFIFISSCMQSIFLILSTLAINYTPP